MHKTQLKIYETFLDSFGHVNHSKYLELFEQARWDWLADRGIDRSHIETTQIGPIILNVNISYRKELRARETVTIYTQVTNYQKKIFTIQQQMKINDSILAADVKITGGMFDLNQRALILPPQEWNEVFMADLV